MKQPQVYKAPKCSTGKCKDKKGKIPKDLDFSKMTLAENPDEVAATAQQSAKKKKKGKK